MLLDTGANAELCDGNSTTIINSAVVEHKPGLVRLLINRRVNIHHRDISGCSPILDATEYNPNADITRILAEGGANLKGTTTRGQNPLHLAMRGKPEILKILLEFHKTIDMEKRDSYGQTLFLVSDLRNNMECVILLVRAGVDINAQDSEGYTIHMRAIHERLAPEAIDFFLFQPEIKINLHAEVSGTALHIACRPQTLTSKPSSSGTGQTLINMSPAFLVLR